MGGDLSSAPKATAPSFLIRAIKDPDGANLERIQLIKGWLDESGLQHEKIYDIALSEGAGHASTVDVEKASYNNRIGVPEFALVWKDPDFNPDEVAFYYLRVLEIPTPHWTAYDAKYFDTAPVYERGPMVTQERAYTSPIWYTP